MSMNLAFETVNGRHLVDFPFQTPTDLSYKVHKAGTTEERLGLIENQLKMWKWDKQEINRVITEVRTMLNDNTLRLVVI